MEQYKGYKFRIYPTDQQKQILAQSFGCSRKVFNLTLDQRKTKKAQNLQSLIEEYPYLKEVDITSLEYAQANLYRAIKSKNINEIKLKSKSYSKQSFRIKNRESIKLLNKYQIDISLFDKPLKAKVHINPKGLILSLTFSKKASGNYFLSLLVKENIEPMKKTNKVVGIDLGLENFAILSTGQKIGNRRFNRQMDTKINKELRKLSKRREKAIKDNKPLYQASNYQKQKRKVARLYEKSFNQRKYFLDKLSTLIIKNHDVICIEQLEIKEMISNRQLSRSIADVAWTLFVEKLNYKAKWYGRRIVYVDRWFPSSQICSSCGIRHEKMPLSIREWQCTSCHKIHDRDINASRNILFQGLKQANIKTVDRAGLAW